MYTRRPKPLKDILALYRKEDIHKRYNNRGYTLNNNQLTINGEMMDTISSHRTMTLEKNIGFGGKYHYKEVGGWFWREEWLMPEEKELFEKELFEI